MDAATAAKLVSALDGRARQAPSQRDEAEEARWSAACDGDPVVMLGHILDRLANRLVEPAVGTPEPDDDGLVRARMVDELGEDVAGLVERLESWFRHEDAVANGEPTTPAVYIGPQRVRLAYRGERPDISVKIGDDGVKEPKLSRTEIWREQQVAEMEAKLAVCRLSMLLLARSRRSPRSARCNATILVR